MPPVPGIQRVLVERHVDHRGVVVEDVLGAVAVVGVVVDDQHPLAPVGQRPGRDRDVVEQAEAHRPARRGVVPGRAHGAEGGVALAGVEVGDGVETGAGGEQRGLVRARGTATVSGSMWPPPPRVKSARRSRNGAGWTGRHLGVGGRRGSKATSASATPEAAIPCPDGTQPIGSLRVAVARAGARGTAGGSCTARSPEHATARPRGCRGRILGQQPRRRSTAARSAAAVRASGPTGTEPTDRSHT